MCISATKNDVNISVYKKKEELEESASQTPGPNSRTKSLVKRFEKMKSSNSNDIDSKNLNLRGGTLNRPIGCSKTDQPKNGFPCDKIWAKTTPIPFSKTLAATTL